MEVGEEAVIPAFVCHVADGINMDEGADAGDHQQHDSGEAVDCEVATHAETAGHDPIEIMLGDGRIAERHYGLERPDEREHHAADSDGVDRSFREAAAENA